MTLYVYEKDHSLKHFADFHGHDFITIHISTHFSQKWPFLEAFCWFPMPWLFFAISRYIILIGINGSWVGFFASVLKETPWLCISPDPKVMFFPWLFFSNFRILPGPGFWMSHIPIEHYAFFHWGGSWAGHERANVLNGCHGHELKTQFY